MCDCLRVLLVRASEVVLDEQGVALRFETLGLFESGGHRDGELKEVWRSPVRRRAQYIDLLVVPRLTGAATRGDGCFPSA